jgi:hypothetical protein
MRGGMYIDRQYVLILQNGVMVIDWGDCVFQDVDEGTFMKCDEALISHTASVVDLNRLKFSGKIDDFDDKRVYFVGLPDRPVKSLD